MSEQENVEGQAPEVNQGQEGKALVIERYPYGIRLFVNGSTESCFIKDSDKTGWFVFVIEKNREITDVTEDKYENLGTGSLSDLYYRLIAFPVEYYEMLTGKKVDFKYLISISDYKFEVCRVDATNDGSDARELSELTDCYGVHKDEKEIDYNDYATIPPDWIPTFDIDYDFNELLQKVLENPEQGIKEIDKYVKW